MEENNLDNLFKDKFKDFSENPDERVWENIEASLNKKKRKRVIPIWWQLGGVAALLAVLLYIINPFSNDENLEVPAVVNTEKEGLDLKEESPMIQNEVLDQREEKEEGQVVSIEENKDQGAKTNEAIPSNNKSQNITDQKSSPKNSYAVVRTKDTFIDEEKNGLPNQNDNAQHKKQFEVDNQEAIAAADVDKTDNGAKPNNKNNLDNVIDSQENEVVAENQEKKEEGKSIFEAIEEQKELEKEAIASNDNNGRWSVGPSVAPVYFNSLGEGSPIHSNFASNSKSGKFNLSYGLTVTYNVSKKLSIRSGVHKVDYGYDTNDVVFTSSLATSTNDLISNINYAQTSKNLVVESKDNSEVTALSDNPEVVGELSPFEGSMVQQLGYVEVPMELNYALVDKKFGVNLIGGISSLFLVDNAVSLESDQLVTEMGEANNANSVNFSTNVGIGLNYDITPKMQLNLEPMFKYQLNTFSDTAGNFRPYSVGVYSGLRFRF